MIVDLQIDVVRYKSGTPIARFGGAWDRGARQWIGDAETSRIVEVHGAQAEAVLSFSSWLRAHLSGEREDVRDRIREIIQGDLSFDADARALVGLCEMLLTGGRRSGKTNLMMLLLTCYAVSVERSIVWTVTPAETRHVEPIKVLRELMPAAWYLERGAPDYRFDLANDSVHRILSGHDPNMLKQGNAVLVGFNEGQAIKLESYNMGRGGTVDAGGFTIVAANPPIAGDVGTWVLDAAVGAEKGERPGAEHYFCDPLDNPHIDPSKLLALRTSMTAHDFDTQVRGKLLDLPNRVLYGWSRLDNERSLPDLGVCTRDFLTAHEGDRARWEKIAVFDVQHFPYVAVLILDVAVDPSDPHNPRAGILWGVDEVAIPQGDEVDACTEIKARGYRPERMLVIMDASCFWQQMQRDQIRQLPEYRGKSSAWIVQQQGFPWVVPPDRRMKANPDVFDRVRATNASVVAADGVRRLMIDPARCPNAAHSARKWTLNKNGKPDREGEPAHFGDVLGYAVWRFFPRRGSASALLEQSRALAAAGD